MDNENGKQSSHCNNMNSISTDSQLKKYQSRSEILSSTDDHEEEKCPTNNKILVNDVKQEQSSKVTMMERINLIKKNITVEPVLACYFVPSVLSLLCAQNFYLDRACRVNLNFSAQVCDALVLRQTENYKHEETLVQELVSSMLTWKSAIQTSIPCAVILFAGAWSDKHGKRKIFIILPIIGELVAYSSFAASMYLFNELPVEVMILFESIPQALSGGWFVMLLGIFSYISDVTTMENRTFRIGVVNVCMSLGVPLGTSLSGLLLHALGYYGSFLVSIGLYMMSLVYGIYMLHDVPRIDEQNVKTSRYKLLASFFDLKSLKDVWDIAFNDGTLKRRMKIALVMFTVVIVFGPSQGELAVQYLYTRYKFNWDEVTYSFFSTYSMIMFFIGTTIAMGVFSARWRLADATIGVIASTSTILSSFVYVFAASTAVMYLGPVLDIFNGTSYIALRSISSKVVNKDELGKLNSLFGLAESLTPALFSPLYLHIYTATLAVFPGAVFFVATVLAAVAVLIFMWMYWHSSGESACKTELEMA